MHEKEKRESKTKTSNVSQRACHLHPRLSAKVPSLIFIFFYLFLPTVPLIYLFMPRLFPLQKRLLGSFFFFFFPLLTLLRKHNFESRLLFKEQGYPQGKTQI